MNRSLRRPRSLAATQVTGMGGLPTTTDDPAARRCAAGWGDQKWRAPANGIDEIGATMTGVPEVEAWTTLPLPA